MQTEMHAAFVKQFYLFHKGHTKYQQKYHTDTSSWLNPLITVTYQIRGFDKDRLHQNRAITDQERNGKFPRQGLLPDPRPRARHRGEFSPISISDRVPVPASA